MPTHGSVGGADNSGPALNNPAEYGNNGQRMGRRDPGGERSKFKASPSPPAPSTSRIFSARIECACKRKAIHASARGRRRAQELTIEVASLAAIIADSGGLHVGEHLDVLRRSFCKRFATGPAREILTRRRGYSLRLPAVTRHRPRLVDDDVQLFDRTQITDSAVSSTCGAQPREGPHITLDVAG